MAALTPPRPFPLLVLAVLVLSAGGCATLAQRQPAAPAAPTAEQAYQAGRAALAAGDYPGAAARFNALAIEHPDDPYARQAQIELAYVYYKEQDYASAIAAAGRYIRSHPDDPNLDYLYYLRGLASFDPALEQLSGEALKTGVKPPAADLAVQYFGELIARYPDSKYAADARNRLAHLEDGLGHFELELAKLALNRGDYANAGLHAKAVLDNYPTSTVTGEAAALLNMAYRMLELDQKPPEKPKEQSQDTGAGKTAAHDADWLIRQDPKAYAIQLLSTTDKQALLAFAARHHLGDTAYFKTDREGQPWYALVYGVFASVGDARAAAEKLPPILRGQRPWIRPLSEIQAAISLHQAATTTAGQE